METASGGGVAHAEASKGRGSLGQRKGGGAGEKVGDGFAHSGGHDHLDTLRRLRGGVNGAWPSC